MSVLNSRPLFLLVFLACVGLMAFALYLEHVVGVEPCPMCIAQRIMFIGLGLVSLIAAIQGPARIGRRVYAVLMLLFALGGAALASRQLYLQTVPADQLPACLPSLDYMMQVLPFQEVVRVMLHGTADCAQVTWTLFGLSVPEWSLLAFVVFIAIALWQLVRRTAR